MRWKTLCAAAAALVMSVVFLLPVSAAGVYQELEGEDGRKIYVTVPENYNPAYEYPSVYFMPKDGYSAQQYMADHVGEEVRSLEAEGTIMDMIAVFPELTGETDPWSQIRSAVSVVEEHYKVSRKPSMRGILGTGTGGYLAFLLGYCDDSGSLAKEPELFSAIASHDGDFTSGNNPYLEQYGSIYDLLEDEVDAPYKSQSE